MRSQLLEEREMKTLDISQYGLAASQGVRDYGFCATRVCDSDAIRELEHDLGFCIDGDEIVSQWCSQLAFEGFTVYGLYFIQI